MQRRHLTERNQERGRAWPIRQVGRRQETEVAHQGRG
jgi:hypothetical protein